MGAGITGEIDELVESGSDRLQTIYRMRNRDGRVHLFLFRASITRDQESSGRLFGAAIDLTGLNISLGFAVNE